MADGAEDLFLIGDDFEAVLDLLAQDEEMEEHFTASVEDAQPGIIICNDCGKRYKTRGGYERHYSAKHSNVETQITLTETILAEIVNTAVNKIKSSPLYTEGLKKEMELYSYEVPNGKELSQLQTMFKVHMKNGDTEKFYAQFYAEVPLNSVKYFKGLSRNAATLLATKVADSMVIYCKQVKSCTDEDNKQPGQTVLSEVEIAGLQYLGGYVLQNLHKKHLSKNSKESQQAIAILKAGKLEQCSSQQLISNLSRGGLWYISNYAEKMFIRIENNFRHSTSKTNVHAVNIMGITKKSASDIEVLSYYNLMVSNAEILPDTHVIKDVLHGVINLYVRVRPFSLAKDIIQLHKVASRKTKVKALRKEISRSSDEQNQDRLQ